MRVLYVVFYSRQGIRQAGSSKDSPCRPPRTTLATNETTDMVPGVKRAAPIKSCVRRST